MHSLAIKKDGGLWSWGKNFHGALGLGGSGNYKERWAPTQVTVPAGTWAAAAGCSEFSLGIMTDGSLWSWGWSSDGQLGLGDGGWGLERNVPTRVGTGTNWASVASGAWCDGVARQTTSAVWTWGDNWSGQLGQGAFGSTDHVLHYVPAQEVTAGAWTSVVAGWGFMLAAKSDGSLWSCSVNGDGQLSLGDLNNRHTLTPLNFSLTPPDTTKPVPKALANVTVKKGKKATLRYRVDDNAATCTVVIRIKRKAKTVMTLTIAGAPTNVNAKKSFTCKLKKGAYKWYVYAADPAGNKQAMPSSKKLTVK